MPNLRRCIHHVVNGAFWRLLSAHFRGASMRGGNIDICARRSHALKKAAHGDISSLFRHARQRIISHALGDYIYDGVTSANMTWLILMQRRYHEETSFQQACGIAGLFR